MHLPPILRVKRLLDSEIGMKPHGPMLFIFKGGAGPLVVWSIIQSIIPSLVNVEMLAYISAIIFMSTEYGWRTYRNGLGIQPDTEYFVSKCVILRLFSVQAVL